MVVDVKSTQEIVIIEVEFEFQPTLWKAVGTNGGTVKFFAVGRILELGFGK